MKNFKKLMKNWKNTGKQKCTPHDRFADQVRLNPIICKGGGVVNQPLMYILGGGAKSEKKMKNC